MWWISLALAFAGAPTVKEGSVLLPSFRVGTGVSTGAGTAVAVAHGGGVVYLTALQLVAPEGVIPGPIEVELVDWKTGAVVDRTAARRKLEGGVLDPTMTVLWGDLLVFDRGVAKGPETKQWIAAAPLAIGDRCPAVGEVLFLAGPTKLQEGKVRNCEPWKLEIDVAEGFEGAATSGAPWLDATGAVVGLNVGLGVVDGQNFAAAIPGVALGLRLKGEVVAGPER